MRRATDRERLVATIAALLAGVRHVAVGASSPIPAAGAMLARALRDRDGGEPLRLSILGSARHNFFTNGSEELFDCAAQGRIDAFFLGGGQIEGEGNVNLVGAGEYPASAPRWPGSFGSALLYYVVPRVILFREEHSPRVLIEKVDFVSAPGTSPDAVYRPGGTYALLTNLALFRFDGGRKRFRLVQVHPDHGVDDLRARTGFAFDVDDEVEAAPDPDALALALLRGRVVEELSDTYPQFAEEMGAGARG